MSMENRCKKVAHVSTYGAKKCLIDQYKKGNISSTMYIYKCKECDMYHTTSKKNPLAIVVFEP